MDYVETDSGAMVKVPSTAQTNWGTIGGINIFGENTKLPLEHIELLDTMLKDGLKK